MKSKGLSLFVIAFLFLALFAFKLAPAQGALVDPVFVAGNPDCEDLGYGYGVKIDPPLAGTYPIGNGTFTITTDGVYLDWEATIGIDAVIVKGGSNANVYVYDPPQEAFADEGLHSPINPNNNQPYAISHYEFCFDYNLVVEKSAEATMDREWDWQIEKVGEVEELHLAAGQHFAMTYVVTTTAVYTDSNWSVSGLITITNPAPGPATITSVVDMLDGEEIPVTCPFTGDYVLPAGETVVCSYGPVAFDDGEQRLNTATVETTGDVGGGFATADIIFVETACLDVEDDLYGPLGQFCASSEHLQEVFEYVMHFGPYGACYEEEIINTASLMDGEVIVAEDSHKVEITTPCVEGCTLTQGYWKTHSTYGPAPYDATWELLGEDTLFFSSGKTYYQVLWTAPKRGNAYYILAHQYIAAVLNELNEAQVPAGVQERMDWAYDFFMTYGPDDELEKPVRQQILQTAGYLDEYNNGLIGPGHCSESSFDKASLRLFYFDLAHQFYMPVIRR